MVDETLLAKVHNLSDLELAGLLCLIAREHCLISTPEDAVDDLVEELRLISASTFGLTSVVVSCHAHTTLDDFATSLLVSPPPSAATHAAARPASRRRSTDYFSAPTGSSGIRAPGAHASTTTSSSAQQAAAAPSSARIANVVLAQHLDRAPRAVQIQALELLRTRRIFTQTSVQAAPRPFLFVAVLAANSGGAARVTPHLDDLFYLAHWHDPADGFANLEEGEGGWEGDGGEDAETASTESVVKKSGGRRGSGGGIGAGVFSDADVASLAASSQAVQVDVDVVRYQMNIVSFLRMHRAVAGGVSPTATRHFEQLMKSLAPLHRLDFVTPSLVAMAAKKVYLHRIRIVAPEKERSLQWGSELAAIKSILDGVGPEDVIEDAIAAVTAPL